MSERLDVGGEGVRAADLVLNEGDWIGKLFPNSGNDGVSGAYCSGCGELCGVAEMVRCAECAAGVCVGCRGRLLVCWWCGSAD